MNHKNENHCFRKEYLKRKVIPRMGLNNRRGLSKMTDLNLIITASQEERKSNPDLSVSDLYQILKMNYGFVVRRDFVRKLLKIVDPIGVSLRKGNKLKRRQYINKGPNWVWHVDQYDKLSPYGICITGCIDGFSRYLIWLKAGRTNKDPKQIASCFIESIENISGYPHIVRADSGTENVLIAGMQATLRNEDDDTLSDNSFWYGKSTHNQRIERWWGILRQKCTDRWRDHFKRLHSEGHFVTGSKIDKSLVQFCYLKLIRDELLEVKHWWNHHRIRKQTLGDVVSGIPDLLYHNPDMLGVPECRDYKHQINTDGVKFLFLKSKCFWDNDVEDNFKTLYEEICQLHHLNSNPKSATDARNLYLLLRQILEHYMNQ